MSKIKTFQEIQDGDIEIVGGKGLSLGKLTQAGLPVPPGFVITTDAYQQKGGIDENLEREIYDAFDKLGAQRVAVRSSAIAEDAPDASWAGQFESYLNVEKDGLINAVKECWQSANSEIVKAYAESKNISEEQLAIAVVVQKMVASEVSGVAFSVNPISKASDEIMIEAVYGLGELLVQGMVTPDNYVVSKSTFEILDRTVKKQHVMLTFSDGGNKEQPVSDEMSAQSCLNDEQIATLAVLVTKVEKYYATPQDIEWALEDNQFYIVQSRPITTI